MKNINNKKSPDNIIYTFISMFGVYIVNTFITAIFYTAKGAAFAAKKLWHATDSLRSNAAAFFKRSEFSCCAPLTLF